MKRFLSRRSVRGGAPGALDQTTVSALTGSLMPASAVPSTRDPAQ